MSNLFPSTHPLVTYKLTKLRDVATQPKKFRELVRAQGGDIAVIDHPDLLPQAQFVQDIPAPRSGAIAGLDAAEIGLTSVDLGAGRARKGDPIDHAVGLLAPRKVGDEVKAGEALFTVHANDEEKLESARQRLLAAVEWSEPQSPVAPLPLFYGVVE